MATYTATLWRKEFYTATVEADSFEEAKAAFEDGYWDEVQADHDDGQGEMVLEEGSIECNIPLTVEELALWMKEHEAVDSFVCEDNEDGDLHYDAFYLDSLIEEAFPSTVDADEAYDWIDCHSGEIVHLMQRMGLDAEYVESAVNFFRIWKDKEAE